MIEVAGLTKRYGRTVAVDDVSFRVRAGAVTALLGPNGAGKSTVLRVVVGLHRPTAGSARIAGRPYADLPAPLWQVGTLLDAGAVHPGRTAYGHLLWLARSNGVPRRRVEELLGRVGLAAVAGRRVGSFSLGMRQRLGLAAALLGDPAVLILDEPGNGLDPEGARELRALLRGLAAEGRTVLVSSHLMSEVQATADHLLVVGRGRLLADSRVEDLLRGTARAGVRVGVARPADRDRLARLLTGRGATVETADGGGLLVRALDAAVVGEVAVGAGVPLSELVAGRESLEDVYLRMIGSGTVTSAGVAA